MNCGWQNVTVCIENDLSLLHNDRDFEPMEKYLGLQVYKTDAFL